MKFYFVFFYCLAGCKFVDRFFYFGSILGITCIIGFVIVMFTVGLVFPCMPPPLHGLLGKAVGCTSWDSEEIFSFSLKYVLAVYTGYTIYGVTAFVSSAIGLLIFYPGLVQLGILLMLEK